MFKTKILPKVFAISLIFTSCEYKLIEYPDENLNIPISFRRDILPLFEQSCISCHNNESNPPILIKDLAFQELMNGKYLDIKKPASSALMHKIYTNHPAIDTPTKNEISLLLRWMEEGALNN